MNKTLRTFAHKSERQSGSTMGRTLAIAALLTGALAMGGCAHRPNNAQLGTGVGAVAGGFAVGVLENLLGAYVVGNDLKLTCIMLLIIAMLVLRPAGIFGKTAQVRV